MGEVREVLLHLTPQETGALAALTAGVGQLAEQDVDLEAAVVAMIDLGLTRLIEDFELPDQDLRSRVQAARDELRESWTRGNACL